MIPIVSGASNLIILIISSSLSSVLTTSWRRILDEALLRVGDHTQGTSDFSHLFHPSAQLCEMRMNATLHIYFT